MNTTAEIFFDHLGLRLEDEAWARKEEEFCLRCGSADGYNNEGECMNCGAYEVDDFETRYVFTATSPLAEKPAPGWLEALIMKSHDLVVYGPDYQSEDCVARFDGDLRTTGFDNHPTRAVALALLAADPTLRARCEQASDASEVLP